MVIPQQPYLGSSSVGNPQVQVAVSIPIHTGHSPCIIIEIDPKQPAYVAESLSLQIQEQGVPLVAAEGFTLRNLAIDVTPASWPIGRGRDFIGTYDLLRDQLELMDRADRNKVSGSIKINGLDDPALAEHVPAELLEVFALSLVLKVASKFIPSMMICS